MQEAVTHLFVPEPVIPGFAPTPTDFKTAQTVNKGHGRLEIRILTASSMLKDYLDRPYFEQVFKLERRFIHLKTGQMTTQTQYGLTSLSPDQASPQQLLAYVHAYAGIQNAVHYRRDVTFKEDRCRVRIGHAARSVATLNNLVLALILRQGYSNVPETRRHFAARPLDALNAIFQKPQYRLCTSPDDLT